MIIDGRKFTGLTVCSIVIHTIVSRLTSFTVAWRPRGGWQLKLIFDSFLRSYKH